MHASDEGAIARGPNGEALEATRRLTYRQARSWVKRADVRIGLRPCGMDIHWLAEDERPACVQRLRRAEGRDCNVAGDVLLYRAGEVRLLVVEEG